MPPLATTNGFQEIDQKSIQTFVALSDLGLGHARAYQHQTMMSILNVVILRTRFSMSSNARDLVAHSRTHCAVRARTDGGVAGSAISLSSTEAAAPALCCSRTLVAT